MRVAFHTLGCKVNQYETEAMREAFALRGAEIVPEDSPADVYIVNTCTVTNIADRKSRQYIRRMKSANPEAIVVVTGCYAQVEPEEVFAMEEVDLVIGNGLKSGICDKVFAYIDRKNTETVEVLRRNELDFYEDMGHVVASEMGTSRAYIKIQEGCDRFCSYCLIPFARGPVRSRPMDDIIEEAKILLQKGFRELVLTGINTALYGTEEEFAFEPDGNAISPLEELLARLDAIDGDFRIRLSSLEPTVVDKEHVEHIIRYDKLCHHLHLALQSGSTSVLKAMNRSYSKEDYLEIVSAIREYDPLYGITTDIIVGFPGEKDSDFADTLEVVGKAGFGRVHAFRYSPRKGTRGASMKDAVSGTVKSERMQALTEASAKTAEIFAEACMKMSHRVLTEERCGRNEEFVTGYTDNYIKVYIEDASKEIPLGEFVEVQLREMYEDGCLATATGKGE